MFYFNTKIADAGPYPFQNITPLLAISGRLLRVFHMCPPANSVDYSPVMLLSSSCPFPRVSRSLLHFLILEKDAALSTIPSPSVSSYAKYMKYQASIVLLSVLSALDPWCVLCGNVEAVPPSTIQTGIYSSHWSIVISAPSSRSSPSLWMVFGRSWLHSFSPWILLLDHPFFSIKSNPCL